MYKISSEIAEVQRKKSTQIEKMYKARLIDISNLLFYEFQNLMNYFRGDSTLTEEEIDLRINFYLDSIQCQIRDLNFHKLDGSKYISNRIEKCQKKLQKKVESMPAEVQTLLLGHVKNYNKAMAGYKIDMGFPKEKAISSESTNQEPQQIIDFIVKKQSQMASSKASFSSKEMSLVNLSDIIDPFKGQYFSKTSIKSKIKKEVLPSSSYEEIQKKLSSIDICIECYYPCEKIFFKEKERISLLKEAYELLQNLGLKNCSEDDTLLLSQYLEKMPFHIEHLRYSLNDRDATIEEQKLLKNIISKLYKIAIFQQCFWGLRKMAAWFQ